MISRGGCNEEGNSKNYNSYSCSDNFILCWFIYYKVNLKCSIIPSAMLITGVADLLYERNVYGFIH